MAYKNVLAEDTVPTDGDKINEKANGLENKTIDPLKEI